MGQPSHSAREYLDWATRQPDFGNYADAARIHMQQVGAVRK
jgi:hypothetical protein